jgi:hypothetical protein
MIYQLRDGPLCIGLGRTLDEAVQQACDINRRIGDSPTDQQEMKALIDNGSIKVREIRPWRS